MEEYSLREKLKYLVRETYGGLFTKKRHIDGISVRGIHGNHLLCPH